MKISWSLSVSGWAADIEMVNVNTGYAQREAAKMMVNDAKQAAKKPGCDARWHERATLVLFDFIFAPLAMQGLAAQC
jgi:hypothetical protein